MHEQEQGMTTRFDLGSHSFVIRIWRENRDLPDAQPVWRGWIEHVQSRQRHYFQEIGRIHHIVASYVSEEALDTVFKPIQDNTTTT